MPYLKPSIPEDVDCLTKVLDRKGQKNGQWGPVFVYQIEWNGTVYDHDASMTEEKKLQAAKAGEPWVVKKKKNSHGTMSMYWDKASGPTAEALKAAPVAPQKKQAEPDWDEIAASKIIHAFMRDAFNKGMSPRECADIAIQLYHEQEAAVKRAYPIPS